jgi:hypothetical protein
MGKQRIIWTALPKRVRRDGSRQILELSVFVSPRLGFDGTQQTGTLESFRDFWDWPAQLKSGRFNIKLVVDNDTLRAQPAEIVTKPQPDSIVWKGIFPETTLVRGHESQIQSQFQVQREPVSSYPADEMAAILYNGYGEIAKESPYRPRDTATLKRAFPHVYAAIAPGAGSAVLGDLDNLEYMSEAELTATHRVLSENLLRHDRSLSFAEKLSRAIKVAGALARLPGTRNPVSIVPRTNNAASSLAQFAAFHRRVPVPRRVHESSSFDSPRLDSRKDFHQILSALGDYPDLLRRLGVVIDVEVDANRIPESTFGHVRALQVQPVFTGHEVAGPYTPNTRYLLDLRLTGSVLPFPIFAAAPRGADKPAQPSVIAHDLEIVGGLLNLNAPRSDDSQKRQYDLVQIDIDGALTKVLNVISAIVSEEQRPAQPIDKTDEAAAPAFRTSGVSLVRTGHAAGLIAGVGRANDHESVMRRGELADLFAEDLVRGYRIDIRRFPSNFQFDGLDQGSGQPWLSLHQRVGTYAGVGFTLNGIMDEGFIQPAFVQNPAGSSATEVANPVHAPESLFHWKGYSLSAPPPATPTDVLPSVGPANGPTGLPNLNIEFEPANLPRLRFGNYYQVRARTVDLTGNGPSIEEAGVVVEALSAQGNRTPILFESPKNFRYRRFDPISAPELVLNDVLTEGESIDVMVIRSNGSTAAAYAASLGDPKYRGVNERHVVPPKAALSLVESHGMLEGAFGREGNPGHYYNICKRENGTLDNGFITNLNTGERESFPDRVDPHTGETIPHGIRPVKLQPSEGAGRYTIHYEDQLRVPYLPDPLARGAALFNLPGVETTGQLDAGDELKWSVRQLLDARATTELGLVTKINFGSNDSWPELLPFRLRLDEVAGDAVPEKPKWSKSKRELTVRLAPGETRTCSEFFSVMVPVISRLVPASPCFPLLMGKNPLPCSGTKLGRDTGGGEGTVGSSNSPLPLLNSTLRTPPEAALEFSWILTIAISSSFCAPRK